jgi:hypothetical protein
MQQAPKSRAQRVRDGVAARGACASGASAMLRAICRCRPLSIDFHFTPLADFTPIAACFHFRAADARAAMLSDATPIFRHFLRHFFFISRRCWLIFIISRR